MPRSVLASITLMIFTLSGWAGAQAYPAKPVRFVTAFPAGGPSDIVVRAVGKRMAEIMGQPVVIDNRAGAGGNIGAEYVAKSPADGYTVLLGGSYISIAPSLYRKLPFDAEKDFAPIALLVANQYVLVVHPSVPAFNVKGLIRLAQASPNPIKYASAGIGSPPHLAGELFKAMAGINLAHIPYKGATPALVDLMGGHIECYFGGIAGVLPHIKSKKLRALAVTSEKRSSQLPELPTIAEVALPGYDVTTWFGVLAPAGVANDIINRVSAVVVGIVNEPETKAYLIAQGFEPFAGGPERLAAYIRSEVPKFARIIKAAGIKPEF
jgi:tripartite-type tricarboxylate transporter receptor subunit TctC